MSTDSLQAQSAREIAARFGLCRNGREWRGDCPCCGYKAAFMLTERHGRMLGWCASCHDPAAIRELLRSYSGLKRRLDPQAACGDAERIERRRRMQERALALWRGSEPVQGTPAENYLNVRGIVHVATSTIIAVDADPAGDTAARAATLRWQREGRRVRIARPRIVGHDFNDLIHPCGVR